ncbi:hypothetical protein F4677DRAFT_434948 [Hypoxylon crocopeplum]|nr:hypothetical protein F4677DRAFT_434948 [Hypoxylon crocopeplum]
MPYHLRHSALYFSDFGTVVTTGHHSTSHCSGDIHPLNPGSQTLFINVSIEGKDASLISQPP